MKRKTVCFLFFVLLLSFSSVSHAESCEHEFCEWIIYEEPTCEYVGYKYRICEICGYEETVKIPKIEHEWGNWETEQEPSCYRNGSRIRKCLNCYETQSEKISAYNSHQWGDWIETEHATCGNIGYKERYCIRCGEIKCDTIPIQPDNHELSEWFYDKPTALYNGEKYRCCACGKVVERIKIPKLKAIVKLNKSAIKLQMNKIYKLKIKKKTYGDRVLYWKSSNKKIIIVDKNGKIKAKKKGKATITVKMESGVKATCKVTVK